MWIGQQVHMILTPEVTISIVAQNTYLLCNSWYISQVTFSGDTHELHVSYMVWVYPYHWI